MPSTLHQALEQFEATEANIQKLERLCEDIRGLIPSGIEYGSDPVYDDKIRTAEDIVRHLPAIDGFRLDLGFVDRDAIASTRIDLLELGEPAAEMSFESSLDAPFRQLSEYRYRFNKKRRALVRNALDSVLDAIDDTLRIAGPALETFEVKDSIPEEHIVPLRTHFMEIETLLGSSASRPPRWHDMSRHLHFGQIADFNDINETDWPAIKRDIRKNLYGEDDPIPVAVDDLGDLVASAPKGPVPISLNWETLSDEEFERLIYTLIANEPGYENPAWLMPTRAADRGRDLSVLRIIQDGLSGQLQKRVVLQCKHWLSKSVGIAEVVTLKEQMKLWEPPRVDVLVIATSGWFSADAVNLIEREAQSDRALTTEMWPRSHLEMLLARRPGLIAEFNLR